MKNDKRVERDNKGGEGEGGGTDEEENMFERAVIVSRALRTRDGWMVDGGTEGVK